MFNDESMCPGFLIFLYREGVSLCLVSVVGACVFVGISSVIRGCCRWSESSSSMMLAQVFCVCWLCKFVVVLESNVACEASRWSCFVVIGMVLYLVSLSCEIGASCWSSCSRMICGRGFGSGDVSGDC